MELLFGCIRGISSSLVDYQIASLLFRVLAFHDVPVSTVHHICSLINNSGDKFKIKDFLPDLSSSYTRAVLQNLKRALRSFSVLMVSIKDVQSYRSIDALRNFGEIYKSHQIFNFLSVLRDIYDWNRQLSDRAELGISEFYLDYEPFNSREWTISDYNLYRDKFFAPNTRIKLQWTMAGDFTFAIDTIGKATLLRMESDMLMRLEAQDSFFRAIFDGVQETCLTLKVRREHIIEDTLDQIEGLESHQLRRQLRVQFVGEAGVDQGGLVKEFFQLVVRKIFDPKYGMFNWYDDTGLYWFTYCEQVCPCCRAIDSNIAEDKEFSHPQNQEYFLVGVLVALAIYNGVLIETPLPSVVFEKMLSENLCVDAKLSHLAAFDSHLARGLTAFVALSEIQKSNDLISQSLPLDNSISMGIEKQIKEVEDLNSKELISQLIPEIERPCNEKNLTSTERYVSDTLIINCDDESQSIKLNSQIHQRNEKVFEVNVEKDYENIYEYTADVRCADGRPRQFSLIQGDEQQPMTVERNLESHRKYVDLYCDLLINRLVGMQFSAFVAGIEAVLGVDRRSLIYKMTADELESIVCGATALDLGEWRRVVTYEGGYNEESPVIKWFWSWVTNYLSPEEEEGQCSVHMKFFDNKIENPPTKDVISEVKKTHESSWKDSTSFQHDDHLVEENYGKKAKLAISNDREVANSLLISEDVEISHAPKQANLINEFSGIDGNKRYKASHNLSQMTNGSNNSTAEERARLLAFITGSSRAPVGGLSRLPLTIMRTGFSVEEHERKGGCDLTQLPRAHTCFNYLMLPEYPDRETFVRYLRYALQHHEGFGLQ